MIRTMPGSRHYGWWQFKWDTRMQLYHYGSHAMAKELRRLVRHEKDPIIYAIRHIGSVSDYKNIYEARADTFAKHVVMVNAQPVFKELWFQSKTGEVNITEFKDKFKAGVARFLAGAVEGGEVVEIDNMASTSVILNTCYDVTFPKQVLSPYVCLGLGYSMMGIAQSDLVAKPAYKVKMGLGVKIALNVTAHIGGYYHQVLSGIKDMELPVFRLIDDISTDGRTKDAALASFNMAYSGCEVGLNFAF